MKKLISDMKQQNELRIIFDTRNFDTLLKTIVWSRDNFVIDYTNTMKEYSGEKLKFKDEDSIDNYYADIGFEFDSIKEILIQSFFVKYIFYMEKLIKNIRNTYLQKKFKNKDRVYGIIRQIDIEFTANFTASDEYKIFKTMLKIRNSYAHGSNGFKSVKNTTNDSEISDDEIKSLKQKNIIKIHSSSEFDEDQLKNDSSPNQHRLKDDFSQFITLHDFCLLFIGKLKQIIS